MGTTVTSKGQVTIPKAFRDQFDLQPGSQVVFSRGKDGELVLQKEGVENPSKSPFAKLVGIAGPGPSTDEIMALLRGDPE